MDATPAEARRILADVARILNADRPSVELRRWQAEQIEPAVDEEAAPAPPETHQLPLFGDMTP